MRQLLLEVHDLIEKITGQKLDPKDWAPTPKRELGDIAIPCFKLSKILGKAPPVIAQELGPKILAEISANSWVKDVKATGPYLNIFLRSDRLLKDLQNELQTNPKSFGGKKPDAKLQPIVIDFSSPNVAKEIGLHHLRSTAIGNALARIAEHQGYPVVRLNYLGDWGTSFGKLILGLKMFGKESELAAGGLSYMLDIYIRFNQAAKTDPNLEIQAKEAANQLEKGNSDYRRIWTLFRETSVNEFQKLYQRLGIDFDHFDGESLYESKIESVVQDIQKKIGTRISEGATVCDLPGHELPLLLKRDDGASLYLTRDLAAAEDRWERFKFSSLWYVVAIQQKLHFKQVFDALKALEKPWTSRLEHIPFGMMSYGDKTMKSREGNVIFLRDVLDEGKSKALEVIRAKNPNLANIDETAEIIGLGALLFYDLSQNRSHDIKFEWEKALSFEGDTAPFVQYTHARCCSLLKKVQPKFESLQPDQSAEITHKNTDPLWEDLSIRQLLGDWAYFRIYAEKSFADRDPSQIATATLQIAKSFNQLYHRIRFMDETSKERLKILIELTQGTKQILALGLDLLGIKSPVEM